MTPNRYLRRASLAEPLRDNRYGTVWELVTPGSTGSRQLGIAYVEIDPGGQSPRHYHERTEEAYYFVSGSGSMSIGDERFNVQAGDAVYIPPLAVHSVTNSSNVVLCFISADAPPYDENDDIEVN